ncbi:MAG: NAD-dependent epimerase/dehydratase family protein [Myxococcales bacterium]|nr:NAD-dependent epimerase/dehydratase family protein [Myxococcales bacterium]
MKVLVTGADGMLGSYLVRELLARRHAVRAFVQPGSASPTLDGLPLERVAGDLRADRDVDGAVAGCDAVCHCAAVIDLNAAPALIREVNLEGTRRLVRAARTNRVRRFVFVSSASAFQFGTPDDPAETCGDFPEVYRGVAYAESKRAATDLVRAAVREHGLNAVVVAPTFMIGGFNCRPGSSDLLRAFAAGRLRVSSPGGRNFVFAGDAAVATANALQQGEIGEAYLLAGENLTYTQFLTLAAVPARRRPPLFTLPGALVLAAGTVCTWSEKITGRKLKLNAQLARLSLSFPCYRATRAIRDLDLPQTPIRAAIEESLAGLRAYGLLPGEKP